MGGSTVYRTNDASWKASVPRAGAGDDRVQVAQTRARKKPYWWRPPAPVRQRAVPAGRSSCWWVRWSSSPNTRACRTRRFDGAWPATDLKPWRRTWCIPKVDGEYVARMEDVLDLYAENPIRSGRWCASTKTRCNSSTRHRLRPASRVSSNVTITSIVAMVRSISSFSSTCIVPGARSKSPTGGRRRRQCMRDLVDIHYPDAEIIRVVQDNLSTHSAGSLYRAFPPPEARRILRRLEFHYTPKHASWLNMVEIEIGVMRGQCLNRRIDNPKPLRREITAWERRRNAARSRIKWMFTTDNARTKMGRAYPDTSKES